MENNDILNYINKCVTEYKQFVGIDYFPQFYVKKKEISLQRSKDIGFEALADALYDIQTGKHTLEIWPELTLSNMNADNIVFHELTHIWDADIFSQRDSKKHMSNKGYTEYHAAQIDFMKILGASKITNKFSFYMNQELETVLGKITAKKYLEQSLDLATDLINRTDFPANIETLATTLGLIFNYFGRRSICKMYAKDFEDSPNTSLIEAFIGRDSMKALAAYMQGWFTQERVALIDNFFQGMTIDLVKKGGLA